MNFKEATERAKAACITLADVAERAGVSHNAVRRARLEPSGGDSYRSPPPGWEAALASLARERAETLLRLADELQGGAPKSE